MKYQSRLLLLIAVCSGHAVAEKFGAYRRSAGRACVVRGGDLSDDYASKLEALKSKVLVEASNSIFDLRGQIIDQGKPVKDLGSKAEMIVNQALESFATNAPEAGSDTANGAAYDRKVAELETAIDLPLHVLYLKQLSFLRDEALQRYRTNAQTASGSSDYEAMLQADALFAREAEESTRDGSDWDYASERAFLQSVLNNLAASSRQAQEVQLSSAQKQQTAMQFLQSQQQMIQQLQMQLYGQSSPWNVGVAYRIPDTNFNLQGSYQQGRANIQLSCVPDEYAPFLGPNGFTNGVGPGNLGLSLNLSV